MRFRPSPEDFFVEEVPLPGAPPEGSGGHTWIRVEKRGISTLEAIRRLAARLGRSAADIGHAGLKDAHATTTQWLSVEGLSEADRARVAEERLAPLAFVPAARKLALGELSGNRFRVRLRDVSAEEEARARASLAALAEGGVPSFFGRQRFGIRGLGHRIGRAVLLGDARRALEMLLGWPRPVEGPRLREARERYESGDFAGALRGFPASFDAERRALEALVAGAAPGAALEAVPWKARELYLSAYQASLFDRLLEERVAAGTHGKVLAGDVVLDEPGVARAGDPGPEAPAPPGASGGWAPRLALDPAPEAEGAARLLVSPAGPLFGYAILRAEGEPGAREERLLKDERITTRHFLKPKGLALRGARRAYRFPVRDAALEREDQGALLLRFELPPGCYATTLLAQLGATVEDPDPIS